MTSDAERSAFQANFAVMIFTSITLMVIAIFGAVMMIDGFSSELVAVSGIVALASAGMFIVLALGSTIAISSQLLRNPLTHARILRLLNLASLSFLVAVVGLFAGFFVDGYILMPAAAATVVGFVVMRFHIIAGWGLVHIAMRNPRPGNAD
jgi:hypothetical protein